MSGKNNDRSLLANSTKYSAWNAFWKMFAEYVADYFSGHKYRPLNNQQQKQK